MNKYEHLMQFIQQGRKSLRFDTRQGFFRKLEEIKLKAQHGAPPLKTTGPEFQFGAKEDCGLPSTQQVVEE